MITINEFTLRSFLRCPLGAHEPEVEQLNVLPVLEDVLRGAGSGKWMRLNDIGRALSKLNNGWYERALRPETKFEEKIRLPMVAHRLNQLAYKYSVASPPESYSLTVGGVQITGQYAVLQRKGSYQSWILYLRGLRREHQPVKPLKRFWPDIVSCARLVDFAAKFPGRRCVVLNWHVTRELKWCDQIDLDIAQQALEGAARNLESGIAYPNPGYHCRACLQPKCCFHRVATKREKSKEPELSAAEKLEKLLAGYSGSEMFRAAQRPLL